MIFPPQLKSLEGYKKFGVDTVQLDLELFEHRVPKKSHGRS